MSIKSLALIIFTTASVHITCAEPSLNTPLNGMTANTPDVVMFTPPTGWRHADASALPEHVSLMVVGKGSREFPPSMTLGTEIYKGTLKQYLNKVKEINRSKGYEWKDLGTLRTEAGNASLSQVDTRSEWGDVRMMHVIVLRDETIYILTAASLKEEFASHYKDIFNSFRSLRFSKTPYNTTAYEIQKKN
ncbi:MAG: hypothetical protein WCF65_04705 [Parachlamydiaceae bacterium]